MREIPLSQGKVALVSDEDFERVNAFKWSATLNTQTFRGRKILKWYAVRNERVTATRRRTVYMHRFIVDAQPNAVVNHLNGNGLDNRRENLEPGTSLQNNGHVKFFHNGEVKTLGAQNGNG